MTFINRNEIGKLTFTTLSSGVPAKFDFSENDEKSVIVVQNSGTSAVNLAILSGNGIQGVNDLTVSVPASSVCLMKPDSGRFKNVSGENKGKIVLRAASANLSACVVSIQ